MECTAFASFNLLKGFQRCTEVVVLPPAAENLSASTFLLSVVLTVVVVIATFACLRKKPKDPLEEAMLGEIATMMAPSGFDYLIVCCSNLSAENFWQSRLEATVLEVTGYKGSVICVHEDWNGGAGNGLGTLYAFEKASAKAGKDLIAEMKAGSSVAIYHTAGKGTRMAPLPGAENNNKPGVKLPGLVTVGTKLAAITVLESVMRQTSAYAKLRPGRCSVFWGDQVTGHLGPP